MRFVKSINWVTALFLILTPLTAVVWGGVHITHFGIYWFEVLLFVLYIGATGFSITAGYHRHFAHGAYECTGFVRAFYLLFGAAAFQHSVLSWASDHRRHHKNIDEEQDPYNIRKGFLWAHIGWLMFKQPNPEDFSNVPDLVADPMIRWQHRHYVPLAIIMGFFVPLAIGFAIGHPWGCLLWAGVFRTVIVHHSTFFVNSLAHTLGRRPYSIAVSARDSVVTALLTMGEGYHNFHHRFATDYRNGVRRHQWDPTKWLTRGLEAVGWAWALSRTPREKIMAAEIECETQQLVERWKGHSVDAMAFVRSRIADIQAAVERSAARVGELERQVYTAGASFRRGRWRQMVRVRAELRAARREFRAARGRWRAAIAELSAPPAMPAPALG